MLTFTDLRYSVLMTCVWRFCSGAGNGELGKGSKSGSGKNLNDSSNTGASDDDSSDGDDGVSVTRGSEHHQPSLAVRNHSSHSMLQLGASTPTLAAAANAAATNALYHHPSFKFNHHLGAMSHHAHQPFADVAPSALVNMHVGNQAEAMLHLSAAAAAAGDYSSMSALGSVGSNVHTTSL